MRLNKFLALAGVGSRRTCDEIIASGRVRVNAKIVRKMGIEVIEGQDIVALDNKTLTLSTQFDYYMLNKPLNTITSVRDQQSRKTVMECIPTKYGRLFPVGRLDYNTTGLLILTNNGSIAQKMMHPKYEIEKEYLATIRSSLSLKELKAFSTGLDLGDFVTKPAQISLYESKPKKYVYSVIIHEGKNRQVRRMFAAIGHEVLELKRVRFGKLVLGELKLGDIRPLKEHEKKYLLSL